MLRLHILLFVLLGAVSTVYYPDVQSSPTTPCSALISELTTEGWGACDTQQGAGTYLRRCYCILRDV